MSTLAAEGHSGASIASPSFVKHRGRLFSSHLSIRSRISALPTHPPRLLLRRNRRQPPASEPPLDDERRNRTFLVDAFHHKRSLKVLLDELSRSDSCPLRILAKDGDWPFEELRVVFAFLADTGRITEALQIFNQWKSMETSRASAINYSKIIRLLCEKDLIDEAMLILQEMEKLGFIPSVAVYNLVIHGFARIKEFNKSKTLLRKMVEDGLSPFPETYNGLLQAYGSYGFYDEMSICAKTTESAPCHPNELTYNILIQEFSRGRLIQKMEKFYRILLSKRMNLQICTLIAMLEAYSDLGILEKMEKMYTKVLNANVYIKDRLIRKMAHSALSICSVI